MKGKKLPELQSETCSVTSILDEEEEEETEEEDRLQVVNFLGSPSPWGLYHLRLSMLWTNILGCPLLWGI